MDWYTVIPTYNRPDDLAELLHSLATNQVADPSTILIINNGDELEPWFHKRATVVDDVERGPHIYQQWNWGLNWAERRASELVRTPTHHGKTRPHAVAILNDDVALPPDFAAQMIQCLRDTNVTIAFPDQGPGIHNQHPPGGSERIEPQAQKRITGYAFVVNGTHGIRCDESFLWWFGDDDLDWQARRDYNGTWEVPGAPVLHRYPSESTNASPTLSEQASKDRATFVQKWGKAPW